MIAVARALLGRSILNQLVVGAAVAVLVVVAALADGSAVDAARIRRFSGGFGAALGVAWALARWRSEAGDVALANLGVRPLAVVLWLGVTATPALAIASVSPPPRTFVTVTEHATRIGVVTLTWDPAGATRDDLDGAARTFPGLAPPAASRPPRVGHPALPWAWRSSCLLIALAWLGLRPAAPGAGATLSAGALAALVGALPFGLAG